MTSLAFCAGSVPQVTDRRCVFTAGEPPPCPAFACPSWDGPNPCWDMPCPTCGRSGVAPSGTDIVIWTPERKYPCGATNGRMPDPAGVVIGGKLDKVIKRKANPGWLAFSLDWTPDYRISLSECVLLDPPITEWRDTAPLTQVIDPVASLPAGWSVCAVGLAATIGER